MARAGPRKVTKYDEQFKATAMKLGSLPSVEYQQVGPRSMAAVQDTGIDDCVTMAFLHKLGTAESCTTVGIQFIESPDR